MARNGNNSGDFSELLFQEIRDFRKENREDYNQIQETLAAQKEVLSEHSVALQQLTEVIHGNGNKGVIDRIEELEKAQHMFEDKFSEIETKEKIRAAILGVICAICSAVGGVITYMISVYISLKG